MFILQCTNTKRSYVLENARRNLKKKRPSVVGHNEGTAMTISFSNRDTYLILFLALPMIEVECMTNVNTCQ